MLEVRMGPPRAGGAEVHVAVEGTPAPVAVPKEGAATSKAAGAEIEIVVPDAAPVHLMSEQGAKEFPQRLPGRPGKEAALDDERARFRPLLDLPRPAMVNMAAVAELGVYPHRDAPRVSPEAIVAAGPWRDKLRQRSRSVDLC